MDSGDLRIRTLNEAAVRPSGDFVLYWMVANRRTEWNFSLDRALAHCRRLNKPLVIFEPLRAGYHWASDRFHKFVADGMSDNAARCHDAQVCYYPYLERSPGDGSGLLEALAQRACVVVTDDFPCFFLPQLLALMSRRLDVRLEAVDSNGILPLRATTRVFARAFDFRRFLQKSLRPHLSALPVSEPLSQYDGGLYEIPRDVLKRWPAAEPQRIAADSSLLADFAIDHLVPVSPITGGSHAARQRLSEFVSKRLPRYTEERNHPDADAASGLSPYLHFGHLSAHEVFATVATKQGWKPRDVAATANGSAKLWWGGSPELESFFDELITWRELGFNMCAHEPRYDRFESLPDWARRTLKQHERDARPNHYTLEELAAAETYDEVWNASQRQLLAEGRIQNYLRMLWGKKILEWSPNARTALSTMIELNNRYALDGRNPNSYSGIFWVLGRYDRAWGPERPIFGTVRYMSSENTVRKLKMKQYLFRWSSGTTQTAMATLF